MQSFSVKLSKMEAAHTGFWEIGRGLKRLKSWVQIAAGAHFSTALVIAMQERSLRLLSLQNWIVVIIFFFTVRSRDNTPAPLLNMDREHEEQMINNFRSEMEEKIKEKEREKQELMREKEESKKRAMEEKRAKDEEKRNRVKENLKKQEQCPGITKRAIYIWHLQSIQGVGDA